MESRRERGRHDARAALRPLPEVIGGALGAGLGVWLPFLVVEDPESGWLVVGAIVGALIGAALPPAVAYARAHLTYDRYVLEERVTALETGHATAVEKPSVEEAALREFVWQLRRAEKRAVVLRDSITDPAGDASEELRNDVDRWRQDTLALLMTQDKTLARPFAQGIETPVGRQLGQLRNELNNRRNLLDRLITAYETEVTLAEQRRQAGLS